MSISSGRARSILWAGALLALLVGLCASGATARQGLGTPSKSVDGPHSVGWRSALRDVGAPSLGPVASQIPAAPGASAAARAAQPTAGAALGAGGGPKDIPTEPPTPTELLSSIPVPENQSWKNYVIDSKTPLVYPTSVQVETNGGPGGAVTDPTGLAGEGGAFTTLTSTAGGDPRLILDLGILVGGRVEVGISSTTGAPLRVSYAEARRFLTVDGDTKNRSQGINDDPDARADFFTTNGPNISPGIRGAERWMMVELDTPGTVQIDYIRVRITHLRPSVADYAGHFLSNDKILNRAWYASAYTFNTNAFSDRSRNSNQTVIADGAKRDRVVWLGDLAMQTLIGSYTVAQAPEILRHSIQLFTCQQYSDGHIQRASDVHVSCPTPGPANGLPRTTRFSCKCLFDRPLTEYTAWFVIAAADYFRYSGDRVRIQSWLPVMERAVKFFENSRTQGRLFSTRSDDINWHPPDIADGRDTHTNAVWVRAFQDLAFIEGSLGDSAAAKLHLAQAARLQARIRYYLYDPAVGAFLGNTGDTLHNHTQDANVEAVLSGTANKNRAGRVLSFIRRNLWGPFGPALGERDDDPYFGRYISPWISGWELLARLERNDTQNGLDLIRREWGRMVSIDPGVTVWEKMTTDGFVAPYQSANPGGTPIGERQDAGLTSLAHSWSGGPVPALSGYVAGVRPARAGWKRWVIQPQPGDLKFAQADVGTRYGTLSSRWTRGAARKLFRLTIEAPLHTVGVVAVPLLGKARTIAADGKTVWEDGAALPGVRATQKGDYVFFAQSPGTHTFAWGHN